MFSFVIGVSAVEKHEMERGNEAQFSLSTGDDIEL